MNGNITWGSIRNKSLKSLLICEYVLETQREFEFSTQKTKDFKYFINKGILLGYINSNDIILNDNGTKIDEIVGINIKNQSYEEQHEYKSYNNSDINVNPSYHYFYNYWRQFLINWHKLIKNNG